MVATTETRQKVQQVDEDKYKYGFTTDIEMETAPKGLNEDVIRFISAKKNEPNWLLQWRLKAFHHWQKMPDPQWASLDIAPIDYNDIYYYAAPKTTDGPKSLDEVDPKLLETYEKLGIPLREQEVLAGVQGAPKVAIDAVFDSVSVATTYKKTLEDYGVIFCSISEAVQTHPELVKRYLGSVVPYTDNKHACLNSAVFTDGSFVYIPKNVRCPMELSTYFRINAENTGQFERTLIIADDHAYVSYLEGCTAPQRDENQLHAAVVELVTLDTAEIKYSTVQNWYPGDEEGRGGIYNFVTKRGACRGKIPKSVGPKSRPGRRLHGNILAVFCKGMARWASSTRLPLPTINNRPIQVPKWCILAKIPVRELFLREFLLVWRNKPIGVWCALVPKPMARAISPNATVCLSAEIAAPIPYPILKTVTHRRA